MSGSLGVLGWMRVESIWGETIVISSGTQLDDVESNELKGSHGRSLA